jgi:hypothetical protein
MSPHDAPLTPSVPAGEQGMDRSRRDLASRAIALAILLAACSSGGGTTLPFPSSSQGVSSSPSVTTTDPQPADRTAVEAAYRSYWRVVIDVGRTADWRAPVLTEWTTGAALRTLQRRFYALSRNGQTLRGSIELNPTVVSMTPGRAMVRDCQDGAGLLVYDRNGRPMGTGSPRLDLAQVTLVKEGDRWKVSDIKITAGGC